ncbi:hypothetical protein RD792_006179 [Penstemon davidsonii]|uniref:Aldehyde dehydrogenase domain-containing protein n=1 Tax=Penstemon davidsonii TaxID=160366 RepID=A0ABR0DC77_9LAMI|nr:hypothetical protein RD792_006179 [Penstemon davidsonii]
MFAMKVGPALAAGCTMLVKPAEQTPLSALYYAHLAKLAGLPDGVLNVVTGYGRTVGAAITSHLDIDKVSFTGSTEVGRLVMQAAALSNLKHVSLELGGKSPFIVFDDADIDKIASLALQGTFINKGEVCVAGSRVFVQQGIYDKFLIKLVDKNQYERVLKFMEIGKKEGATLLTGGGKLSNRKGYYIEPTIFTDVSKVYCKIYCSHETIGVVGHIIPWNSPSYMFAMKVGPALAAGCTMLVKPAEQTPLSALYYAHLAKLAGLPDGVLNVVTGYGRTVGAAITSHMDIDKVSFTGSTEVGRLVMQAAALSNLKHVSLELGGKSPFIVFDDADIDKIASLALQGTFINKGEVCVAGSRVFVQQGIYDKFLIKLVDKNQYERVLKFMEIGKKEGATLLTGGGKLSNRKGYYIEPTIFTDVSKVYCKIYCSHETIGVVGHIIPWNSPSYMFAMKVGPALAAGCTMLVKPAEQTPLSALYYAHLAKLAGLPDGVLNVVTGYGRTVGAAITSHMDIDKVSFTGSTEVGRLVMQAAALSNLKHVSLELGGKSPFIVFDDADIDKIASLALQGTFINKGEVCVAGSRVFVQQGIYDKFLIKLVDKNQYERVLKFMEIGKKEGATLLTGGGKLSNRKGYYIEPTIFTDVSVRI